MGYPSVHVVLLNWNGLVDTLECIESLKAQDYPNLKIHVVDNASANGEADLIADKHRDIGVLRQSGNLGFCGGNNVGIRQATNSGADYVLVLNNDTIVPPSLISQLVSNAERLESVGAISPLILRYPDRELIWFAGARWDSSTCGFRHILAGRPRLELAQRDPFTSAYACGCCLLVSKSVLKRVGLMDERYFAYYDEADWCSRMQRLGLKCYVVPSAELYHKVSGATPSLISTYLMARNRFLWMRDYLSLGERLRSYPYLLRELLWNLLNLLGAAPNGHNTSPEFSRVFLLAWRDAVLRRVGKWPKQLESIVAELHNTPHDPSSAL